MTAAILAVLTAAQQTPAERLVQFLSSAKERSVVYKVETAFGLVRAKLSYQDPNFQYMSYEIGKMKGEFYQIKHRVLFINHEDQSYFEYKGFPTYSGLPPESGLPNDVYPNFLHVWTDSKAVKDFSASTAPSGADSTLDWITQSVEVQGGMLRIFVGVRPNGEPGQVQISSEGQPPINIEFEKFGWPDKDVRAWRYQPPVGYSLGNVPKMHRPYQAGNKVEWGKWADGSGKAINMDQLNSTGVAVVFTSAGGPDRAIVSDLADLKKSLAKLKVNLVEVHLDEKTVPKREWPVTLDVDGAITKQFDPPHTPYIFFVRKDRFVIGAWAGYGADQKAKLIKTANDLYNPPSEE